jgi:hypothetical protein
LFFLFYIICIKGIPQPIPVSARRTKGKGKVVPALNKEPRHEDVLTSVLDGGK